MSDRTESSTGLLTFLARPNRIGEDLDVLRRVLRVVVPWQIVSLAHLLKLLFQFLLNPEGTCHSSCEGSRGSKAMHPQHQLSVILHCGR